MVFKDENIVATVKQGFGTMHADVLDIIGRPCKAMMFFWLYQKQEIIPFYIYLIKRFPESKHNLIKFSSTWIYTRLKDFHLALN